MAEEDSSQEKTEEPTQKRIEKAREDGQVPRSKELNTSVVLVTSALCLIIFGPRLSEAGLDLFRFNFRFDFSTATDPKMASAHLMQSIYDAIWAISPIFVILLIAALLGPIGIGGWNMSVKAIQPKLSKLNPLKGLKRMFSMNSLVELIKSWAKVALIAGISTLILMSEIHEIISMAMEPLERSIAHAAWLLVWSFLLISLITWIIVVFDVPYQIMQNTKKLKMSLQEIKEEFKNTEGKPEVKAKIRQLQREMAQNRMMNDVPDADVVITNPEHYSVALKYDPSNMPAPLVLAKGVDHIAFKIREIAKEHNVPIVEMAPLARSIYTYSEIGDEIPQGLYMAVAQVLAYVYQVDEWQKGRGQKPQKVSNIDIPEDLQVEK